MSIQLCLFDLDNTLLRTEDLEVFRGRDNVGNATLAYAVRLKVAASSLPKGVPPRHVYTQEQLLALKARFPSMRWGVFTRSPRYYATTLLQSAYPNFQWDIVVGFEDVARTKPDGDGVWLAMRKTGVDDPRRVALVGDEKVDVVSAYRAGCWSFVDQSTWEPKRKQEHWYALERVPDALFTGAEQLGEVLASPMLRVPELEYLVAGERVANRQRRIDKINHFFPRTMGGGHVPIYIMGRLFGEYADIKPRRSWHELTDQVIAHKDADAFPDAWIEAIHRFVKQDAWMEKNVVVTVIPFKPKRKPRLEALLAQTAATYQPTKMLLGKQNVAFIPDILAFRDGAMSSHGNHLSAEERFSNVGENLYVRRPQEIKGKHVIVVDDVVTSGATLLWAHRYLTSAGAKHVSCLALTQAIGAN